MDMLSAVKAGERVMVKDIACAVNKQRLLDLGIFSGAEVHVSGFAPFGDPIIIEVGDFKIALRKNDAKNILVEKI